MATPAEIIRAGIGNSAVSRDVEERLDSPENLALAAGARNWFGVEAGATVFLSEEGARLRGRFGFPDATSHVDERYMDLPFDADGALIVEDTTLDDRFGRAPVEFGGLAIRLLAACLLVAPDGEPAAVYLLADREPKPGFDQTYRDQLVSLARRIEANLVTDSEIDRAAEVQRSLLPENVSPAPGYRVAGFCQPAREIGGDFFDWYPTPDGLAFTVADVMGKGIGSAILAAGVRATLRSAAHKPAPSSALFRAANALEADLETTGRFVTLLHGRIAVADGRIRYVDAGHGLAIIVPEEGEPRRLAGVDAPLGLSLDREWENHEDVLDPGDTLVICSDGVLDLADGSLSALDAIAAITRLAETVDDIVSNVEELARSLDAADDVTLVAIRRDAADTDSSRQEPAR